jgi:hypothetical protein
LAIAVCEVDGVGGRPAAVLLPGVAGVGAGLIEISDLGFSGGLGLAVFAVFTAGASDFLASTDGSAAGGGWDFLTVCVFGRAAFLAVLARIFLRTIFGVAGLSAGWSQPSRTIKKQIKQVKLQMIIRFFFMMFQLIF